MDEDAAFDAILASDEIDVVALCKRLGIDPVEEARKARRILASIEEQWEISDGWNQRLTNH